MNQFERPTLMTLSAACAGAVTDKAMAVVVKEASKRRRDSMAIPL
jgi:hypothetical protein